MAKNFGYEIKGGTSEVTGEFFASRYICPEAGILNSVSVYLKNASGVAQNVQVGIYNDNAGVVGTKLINSVTVSIPDAFDDWQVFNLSANLNLGAAYWLTLQLENGAAIVYVYHDAGSPDQQAWKLVWVMGTWTDNPTGLTYSGHKISIYATYTPVSASANNWGYMAKSSVDPELVEGAIDRIVQAHDDDPTAHLDATQALQSHKAAEIIDHVVGSVIADKLSMSEMLSECTFESLDNWLKVGTVALDSWPGLAMIAAYSPEVISQLNTHIYAPGNGALDYTKNMLFQFVGYFDVKTDLTFYAHYGIWGPSIPYGGFGFKLINGVLKGYWKEYLTLHETAELSFNVNTLYVFRAVYDSVAEDVKFYMNGSLVGTIVKTGVPATGTPDVYFYLKKVVSGSVIFRLRKVFISCGA